LHERGADQQPETNAHGGVFPLCEVVRMIRMSMHG
jgi:hypothetical protein